MKFLVTRTSAYGAEDAPCLEAVQETYDDAVSIPPGCPAASDWKAQGIPHTVRPDGWLTRTEPRLGWFLHFADLHALVSFLATHGECVLTGPPGPNRGGAHGVPTLEIYDTYRE